MPQTTTAEAARCSAVCPACQARLWKERAGEWTLKAAILKLTDAGIVARCPESGCRGEVPIPWLHVEAPASEEAPARPSGRRILVRRAALAT